MKHITFAFLTAAILLFSSCNQSEGNRLYDEAVDYWKSGYYDEALQTLIALTKSYSTHPLVDDALFLTAGIYDFYLQEPKNAVRFYRILNKNFPDSKYYVDSMVNLADIYSNGPDSDKLKAVGIYKTLHQENHLSNQDREHSPEAYLYNIAWIYMLMKELGESRKYLKELITAHPDTDFASQAFFLLGYTFVQERMLRMAEITFNEAITKFGPERATDSILGLGNLYENINKLDRALETYQLAAQNLNKDDSLSQVLNERIVFLQKRLSKINR